jgi:hypothetical protein
MNIFNNKGILSLGVAMLLGAGCTSDFERINTNPYELDDSQIAYSDLFNEAQLSIFYNQSNGNWEYQLIQNLNADLYSGYLANASAFNGGLNNSNYYMMDGWNSYTLNYMLLHVVKPMTTVLNNETVADDYYAIAEILKVAGAHKMVDTYGPCPYSEAMQGGLSVKYDSDEDCYKAFLEQLEDACDKLTDYIDENGDKSGRLSWDKMLGGSHTAWLQFGNTLRLRLAMRCAVVAPDLAKKHAEAACANKYGLLKTLDAEVKDAATRNPQSVCCRDYSDNNVSADFESIMKGYNDPRMEKMIMPVGWGEEGSTWDKGDIKDANGNNLNMRGQYKGIRRAMSISSKGNYVMFSIPYVNVDSSDPYSTLVPLPIMSRAEASFLQAEGVLRGWNMGGGDAKSYYEEGIRNSFTKYGLSDKVDAYLAGETIAADYVDPFNPAMSIAAVNDVPVKFLTSGDKEQQLQQIITQKWIAGFPEGLNAWAEQRRTGYPKLFPGVDCQTQAQYLSGSAEDIKANGPRRLPFAYSERNSNPAGLETGKAILQSRGQSDVIDARIWWDTGKNF